MAHDAEEVVLVLRRRNRLIEGGETGQWAEQGEIFLKQIRGELH